jgi:hypothetical protein
MPAEGSHHAPEMSPTLPAPSHPTKRRPPLGQIPLRLHSASISVATLGLGRKYARQRPPLLPATVPKFPSTSVHGTPSSSPASTNQGQVPEPVALLLGANPAHPPTGTFRRPIASVRQQSEGSPSPSRQLARGESSSDIQIVRGLPAGCGVELDRQRRRGRLGLRTQRRDPEHRGSALDSAICATTRASASAMSRSTGQP